MLARTITLLALLPMPAIAQDRWTVTALDDVVLAATQNQSGGTLGFACYLGHDRCYWVLIDGAGCKAGQKVPAVMNTDGSAENITLQCLPDVEDRAITVIEPLDAMERASEESLAVGIAIPMRDGSFKVSRFTMRGSKAAVAEAAKKAAEKAKASTRDLRL